MLRPHQQKIIDIAKQIIAGQWDKRLVTADVVPGGGKSKMSSLFANELLTSGYIDAVLHFVPRSALRDQVEKDYAQHSEFNPGDYRIIKSSNKSPLYSRDEVGIVASFAQLAANTDLYIEECRRRRCLVIFDEVHFLGDKTCRAWARAAVAVADVARVVLAMSGTIWRHDETAIPLLEYSDPDHLGRRRVKADVHYSLTQAIGDESIKPVDFSLHDGDVTWADGAEEMEATLSTAETEDERDALRTFLLRQETWSSVVDVAIERWGSWRREVYPSRVIAIAYDQQHARDIAAHIERRHGISCALAISDEDDSDETLRRFREYGRPEVLVTVGKASVGFDVSDVTHLIYLSNWRSLPNFLQALARAMRVDYRCSVPPSHQWAFAFAPDDKRMRTLIQWVRDQVDIAVKNRKDKDGDDTGIGGPGVRASEYRAIDATPGAISFEGLSGRVDDDDAREVEALLRECPAAAGTPPSKLAEILKWKSRNPAPQIKPVIVKPVRAPSEEKGALRAELHRIKRQRDRRLGLEFGTTGKDEYKVFGKLDDGVTFEELQRRLDWVRSLG
jgi:superfamily II DNA or RNA helicase